MDRRCAQKEGRRKKEECRMGYLILVLVSHLWGGDGRWEMGDGGPSCFLLLTSAFPVLALVLVQWPFSARGARLDLIGRDTASVFVPPLRDFAETSPRVPDIRCGTDTRRCLRKRFSMRYFGRAAARPYQIGCRRWMGFAARPHVFCPHLLSPSSLSRASLPGWKARLDELRWKAALPKPQTSNYQLQTTNYRLPTPNSQHCRAI
jgi:hypothetical protein